MKDIVIYDPQPSRNLFVTQIYFNSIIDRVKGVSQVDSLEDLHNKTVLLLGEYLTPVTIPILKNNDNSIVAFDVNDSSWLTQSYANTKFVLDVDLILKASGIQQKNYSNALHISNDMKFSIVDQRFMDDEHWKNFKFMSDQGRLLSIPYVGWMEYDFRDVPFDGRHGVLIRGGHHFERYVAFLNFLHKGLVDHHSAFFTHNYLDAYCKECKEMIGHRGGITLKDYRSSKWECIQTVQWQKEMKANFFNEGRGEWNNKCIPMFYWMADYFQNCVGPFNEEVLESAMNNSFQPHMHYKEVISRYLFYADYKWSFSVFAPPRWWEAAQSKIINLSPRRVNDQLNFPAMQEGDHYMTFAEDFSDIEEVVNSLTEEKYNHITSNLYELFMKWIKREQNGINNNLLNYIMERIDHVR